MSEEVGKSEATDGGLRWNEGLGVIQNLIECFRAWEPDVRVLGNVRAGDAVNALELHACYMAALINLVNQIRKANPVDDHGHQFSTNRAYLEAVKLLDA